MASGEIEANVGSPGPPAIEDTFEATFENSGKVRVVVVTPEREVLDRSADFVVLPMYDGELGVLPKRAPLVGRLGPGELRITRGDVVERYFLEGGFAQVNKDVVTVLTPNARPAEVVTADAASQALRDAEALPAESPGQRAARSRAVDVANAMKRLANKPGAAGVHPHA